MSKVSIGSSPVPYPASGESALLHTLFCKNLFHGVGVHFGLVNLAFIPLRERGEHSPKHLLLQTSTVQCVETKRSWGSVRVYVTRGVCFKGKETPKWTVINPKTTRGRMGRGGATKLHLNIRVEFQHTSCT
eukprot:8591684-Pyramimonas_sp.AAC.2